LLGEGLQRLDEVQSRVEQREQLHREEPGAEAALRREPRQRKSALAAFDAEHRKAAFLRELARRRKARCFEAERDDLLRGVEGVDVESHLAVKRYLLVQTDVGVLAAAAGLAVAAERIEVVLAAAAGHAVQVGVAPRIVGQRLLQVRPRPGRLAAGLFHQRAAPWLRSGGVAVVA